MRIATDDQTAVDAFSGQFRLERLDPASDIGPCVIVHSRKDVRRASNHFDALGHRHPGHGQGGLTVGGAVVYPGDYVIMKIKQRR